MAQHRHLVTTDTRARNNADSLFKQRSSHWTEERIARLDRGEIENLRANALQLGAAEVVALCEMALASLRSRGAGRHSDGASKRQLIPRIKAFAARGVRLQDPLTSWGGVRRSDGEVVLSLWADAVQTEAGVCTYLLWAPNINGTRPWSDSMAGQERLKHCELALQRNGAQGLLVFGEALEGHLPEERRRRVDGVDPNVIVKFRVEKRGDEYWAIWEGGGEAR